MRQAVGCALQDSANSHSNAATEDSATTAKRVTDEDGQDSSDETSQVVRRDSNSLVGAALAGAAGSIFRRTGVRINLWKVLDEGRQVQKTTCHALVVTEKPGCGC